MSQHLNIAFPGSGKEQAYQMVADIPVKLDFDVADAVFSSSGNDLIITVENGGSVILKDYLTLAQDGSLPSFELANGDTVSGNMYLFAFSEGQQDLDAVETAADGAAGGSGAGAYSDDAGTLGDGLEALGGQGDAFAPSAPLTVPDTNEPALPAEEGADLYPNDEPVQIVLNPSFEASSYNGSSWTYLDDVDHWENTGGAEQYQKPRPEERPGQNEPMLESLSLMKRDYPANDDEDSPMETWGPRMQQTPEDGVRHMELDSVRHSVDELSQTIATHEGEEVTISFNFSPRVSGYDMATNDFEVMLGGEEVATINWQAEKKGGYWVVTLGENVTVPEGSVLEEQPDGTYTFTNYGYTYDAQTEGRSTDWTELTFNVIAQSDHATLTFAETGEYDDSYGTLLDNVTAYRNFHSVIYDENDRIVDGDYESLGDALQQHLVPIAGTEGNDAIFGDDAPVLDGDGNVVDDTRYVIDGLETGLETMDLDVIDGNGGDDAIYAGNGASILLGGEGGDFIVGGTGINLLAGQEGNDYLEGGKGLNILVGGQGDDTIVAADGQLNIFAQAEDIRSASSVDSLLHDFNSANIIVTGDGNDMIELNNGVDIIFVNESVLGQGTDNTIVVNNFSVGNGMRGIGDVLENDFLVLGEGISVDDVSYNETLGGLDVLLAGDNGNSATLTLVGYTPEDIPAFNDNVIDAPSWADEINTLVQQVIDSGSDLA